MILTAGMAHPRKLIRHAVVALLVGAATAAGARVKATRVEPHKKSKLPAISVYTLSDPVDEDTSTESEDTHELELEITAWVAHADALPVDDAMDDLAEQIEAAMATAMATVPPLGGLAGKIRHAGTTMEVVEDNARSDPLVGIMTLTYAVTYRADITAPNPTDEFLTVDAKHRIAGAVEANQADDQFSVRP